MWHGFTQHGLMRYGLGKGVPLRRTGSTVLPGLLGLLAFLSTGLPPATAQALPNSGTGGDPLQLLDRIVAVVDEDPILASEIESLVGLGLIERQAEETKLAFRSRVLDRLIDRLLQTHEVERAGLLEIPVDQISGEVARIERSLGSPEALEHRLEELHLTASDLREILARQLAVLTYVDERLGPRVFVSLDEIRAYYLEELEPALRARGRPLPPLEEVREDIRKVLKERRLNEEIERWTEELRLAADIQIYLDELPSELPPVVERMDSPPAAGSTASDGR